MIHAAVFDFGELVGAVAVELRCPVCSRFLARPGPAARVRLHIVTGGEAVQSIIGFRCVRCGDVEPRFDWVES